MTDIAEAEARLEELLAAAKTLDHEVETEHIFPFMVKDYPYEGCEECWAYVRARDFGGVDLAAIALSLARALRAIGVLTQQGRTVTVVAWREAEEALADWERLLGEIASGRND